MKTVEQIHLDEDIADALGHLRSAMPDKTCGRADRLARLHAKHVVTPRDGALSNEVESLIQNAAGPATYGPEDGSLRREGSALVVIGESGAGKTTLLKRIFAKRPEFRPYEDRYGNITSPLVSLVAPSPCTLKQLGRELLRALGYPLAREIKEHMVWELVRQQIRLRKVMFIHIDEMQHAVNTKNETECQKLSDTLKNVMQQPDWPVWFILSGVPALSGFVTRDVQLMRRSRIFEFGNLDFSKDCGSVRKMIELMVTKHAEMQLASSLPDEFIHRLLHAAYGRLGVVIQIVRGAIEQAMFDESSLGQVRARHFASAYRQFSGCTEDANVFVRADWQTIEPSAALVRDMPRIGDDALAAKKRRKS
jgi:hypothetical protein